MKLYRGPNTYADCTHFLASTVMIKQIKTIDICMEQIDRRVCFRTVLSLYCGHLPVLIMLVHNTLCCALTFYTPRSVIRTKCSGSSVSVPVHYLVCSVSMNLPEYKFVLHICTPVLTLNLYLDLSVERLLDEIVLCRATVHGVVVGRLGYGFVDDGQKDRQIDMQIDRQIDRQK